MPLDKILLAVGKDDRDRLGNMVTEAVDIAGPTGASVTVLLFFSNEEYEDEASALSADVTRGELTPDDIAARQKSVRTAIPQFEEADVEYTIRGIVGGSMSEQVLKNIEDFTSDLAIIGGNRRSPAGKAMFGDHAQQVLLNASCPVLYLNKEYKTA